MFVVYRAQAFGDPARGYPPLIVVVLFPSEIQLVKLDILGEYLGSMFDETNSAHSI